MLSFTYVYQGSTFHSSARAFSKDGVLHYSVVLPDGSEITVAPLEFPGPKQEFFWLQPDRQGEAVVPPELLQAIGEGIAKALDY
jgi:hypothetical protein